MNFPFYIARVFTVGVIRYQNDFSLSQVFQSFGNGIEVHCKRSLKAAAQQHFFCECVLFRCFRLKQLLNIFSDNVGFQIDKISFVPLVQVRLTDSVRYRGHGKARGFHCSHGQAYAIHRDGTLFDDIAKDRGIRMNGVPDSGIVLSDVGNASDAIHMACYDVSAKTSVGRHGTFQIDRTSNGELCKCRAVQCLVHDIRSKAIREELPDGQTDAVDGDAVADPALALGASLLTGCSKGADGSGSQSSSGDSSSDVQAMDLTDVTDPYLATAGVAGDTVVGTVGDYEVTADSLLYWLNYNINYTKQQYSAYGISDMRWDETSEDGTTTAQALLETAMQLASFYRLLPELAAKEGLSVPQETIDGLKDDEASITQQLGSETLKDHYFWMQMLTPALYQKMYQAGEASQLLQDEYFGEGTQGYPTDAEVKTYAEDELGY